MIIIYFNQKIVFTKPIGIIQLINKNHFESINEYDLKKLEALLVLIGLSIDQTSESHSVLNIRLGVHNKID